MTRKNQTRSSTLPILSDIARRRKCDFFLSRIPQAARVLEVGQGSGWVGEYLQQQGCDYIGIDIEPSGDIVGDIRDWRSLGLEADSFDYIVAFEVVEHVDCWEAVYQLLRPGGKLLATSPVPHMDWFMKFLEFVGLNQPRTSPHDNLIYFKKAPFFELTEYKVIAFLAQWGVFTK